MLYFSVALLYGSSFCVFKLTSENARLILIHAMARGMKGQNMVFVNCEIDADGK